MAQTGRLLSGRPTGLGTAAAGLAEAARPARTLSALHCPPPVRDDPALAVQTQTELDHWADSVGLPPAAVTGLGRLAMLTHPDTDDVARLAVAGRLVAVGRAISSNQILPAEPPQVIVEQIEEIFDGCEAPQLHQRTRSAPGTADPALLSALAGLGSPYQVDRVRREFGALACAPTRQGPHPPWEHLALGHVNAYSPALSALDAVDGYELSPAAAAHPELRRVQRLAALAAALLHDIAQPAPAGLTAAIARADGLGAPAALRRAAAVHDDAMRAFQQHATHLAAGAEPTVRRYLAGLWTWLGGHRAWQAGP